MAMSNEWTRWYLTSSGWVRGTTRLDYEGIVHRDAPSDAVMGTLYEEVIEFFGAPKCTLSYEGQSQDQALVQSLLAKFGEPPKWL